MPKKEIFLLSINQ